MADNKNDKDELEELLNMEFDELDDLDLVDDDKPKLVKAPPKKNPFVIPATPKGKEGFALLKEHPFLKKLDDDLIKDKNALPTGTPLKKTISQISVTDRSKTYKSNVVEDYQHAISMVERIYITLAKGHVINHSEIQALVNDFFKIFINDRCILLGLSILQKDQEDYLYQHAVNVCLLSLNIATASGFSDRQVVEIGEAALLADVGMMKTPDYIRSKNGKLNEEEFYEIRKHPILGIQLLEKVQNLPDRIAYVSYQHHERDTGAGYPKGRIGKLLHEYSKIIAIADIFEAMTSKRAYRPAMHPHIALVNIIKMAKINLLNMKNVQNFLQFTSLYPVGCLVKLNSGNIAKVIQSNMEDIECPIVTVLTDEEGRIFTEIKFFQIDLAIKKNYKIVSPVDAATVPQNSFMDGF